MRAKEKAIELYNKFTQYWYDVEECRWEVDFNDTWKEVRKVISTILDIDDLSTKKRIYWMEVDIEAVRLSEIYVESYTPSERHLPTDLFEHTGLKYVFRDHVYYQNEARPDLTEVLMKVSDEDVRILFNGMQVWLFPDGRYLLECTMGG